MGSLEESDHVEAMPGQGQGDKQSNLSLSVPRDGLLVELNQKLEGAQLPSRVPSGDSAPGHRAGLQGQRMNLWQGRCQ